MNVDSFQKLACVQGWVGGHEHAYIYVSTKLYYMNKFRHMYQQTNHVSGRDSQSPAPVR